MFLSIENSSLDVLGTGIFLVSAVEIRPPEKRFLSLVPIIMHKKTVVKLIYSVYSTVKFL